MDITKVLERLKSEKAAIERAIAEIEAILKSPGPTPQSVRAPERRGRKSMGDQERVEVSTRMKAYWAKKRAERGKS